MATNKHWGLLAEYNTPAELYQACEEIRDAGFQKWDAHTPFPVHGLDKAMGLPLSFLPWLVLVVGLSGTASAVALQYYVHSIAYTLVISGKPFFALPAYVPIIFELSILFSAGAAVFGMLAINRLPMWNHPLFTSRRFERVTDDRFFISIESSDPKFDGAATHDLLSGTGASHVEYVEA
ncbi:MAG: hypothetical protein ACI81R_001405 [Bradymonadia bacterium]|jgi:hypothetical protein